MLGFNALGVYALGQITGYGPWTEQTEDAETWTQVTAQSETWTEVTPQSETWTEV